MYDQVQTDVRNSTELSRIELIKQGLKAADRSLRDQVQTWEAYTNEKADVARDLVRSVKPLLRERSSDQPFRTLSIGSSEEPQFQLLHALSDGGMWLYDCDPGALDEVSARVERTLLDDVHLVEGDFLHDFQTEDVTKTTVKERLNGATFDLITLHHALYYCRTEDWPNLVHQLYTHLLNAPGKMHLALMSPSTDRPHTTTWLYNRFAQKFCGTRNTQNLLELPEQLISLPGGQELQFSTHSSAVRCRPQTFEDLMAVVWMIMLYPHVHDFNIGQRVEITEFVLDEFWLPGRDLVQEQDYLTISKPPQDWQTYLG